MEAIVRRDGNVQTQAAPYAEQSATTTAVDCIDPGADATSSAELEEERSWERTSTGNGQLPHPDIVFKCVDAETAVVVGSAVDEREGEKEGRFNGDVCPEEASVSRAASVDEISMGTNPGKQALQDPLSAVPSSLGEEEARQTNHLTSRSLPDSNHNRDDAQCVASVRGAASTAATRVAVTVAGGRKGGGNEANDDQHPSLPAMISPRESWQQPPLPPPSPPAGIAVSSRQNAEAVRPQVWVPLIGAGDSGCIGMIGVQGFTTGALVGDDDWRDWFMHRMEPLNRSENRNVKRLRLVRPRGMPDKGRLEHAPTGIAAKVVYGSVEKISRKRGRPVYSVR